MDVFKALRALYDERKKLDEVIASLEELQRSAERGEPIELVSPRKKRSKRGRKFMDEAARRDVSQRMKAYWAKRREEKLARAQSGDSR